MLISDEKRKIQKLNAEYKVVIDDDEECAHKIRKYESEIRNMHVCYTCH